MAIGAPGVTKKEKKCRPCLAMARLVTPTNTSSASAHGTMMWLVKVKLSGSMPSRLQNRMNMKSVKKIGKVPCRERVCQYVEMSVVAVPTNKIKTTISTY